MITAAPAKAETGFGTSLDEVGKLAAAVVPADAVVGRREKLKQRQECWIVRRLFPYDRRAEVSQKEALEAVDARTSSMRVPDERRNRECLANLHIVVEMCVVV